MKHEPAPVARRRPPAPPFILIRRADAVLAVRALARVDGEGAAQAGQRILAALLAGKQGQR
jgi:hypothetical protein